jgi:hypothetical protein
MAGTPLNQAVIAGMDSSPTTGWGAAIQCRIAEAIKLHGRLALPFSGGAESCLLLHLAEPSKEHISVVTVDTGAVFPHVREFMDRTLAGWNRKAIKTDVPAYLKTALPSPIFALLETLQSPIFLGEIRSAGAKRIVPTFDCCTHHRGFPGARAVKEIGLRAAISEQIGGTWNDPPQSFEGVEQVSPLIGHKRAEILEMIAAFKISLPENYPEFDAPHGYEV